MKRFMISALLVLLLAACGVGSDGPALSVASLDEPSRPLGATWTESRSPWFQIDNNTHVGSGVIEGLLDNLTGSPAGHHGETAIWYGQAENGIERSELAAYLADDARMTSGRLQRFGRRPPTVRVAHGTSEAHFQEVILAVQLINDSLPTRWKIRLSDDRVAAPRSAETRPRTGEIVITFAPPARWAVDGCEKALGCAFPWSYESGEINAAHIWVDHTALLERSARLSTIIHEILHALGRHHPDPYEFRDTIMKVPGYENSGFILYQLDRDALFAVYDRLSPGTLPSAIYAELGPWERTSDVVLAYLTVPGADITFGAFHRNGLIQPWANGATPDVWLEDNHALQGAATWSGRMLGFTPRTEVVAARTDMTVRLASLEGNISFTSMEKWRAGAAPGALGTGTRWGDGDLRYPIKVYGSAFSRLYHSGDDGEIQGSFFGPAHEGIGGTLRRDDLAAAFGGSR